MSVLDSFFNKGFKGAKCKTLLKLTIPRIKLLRNKREIQLKQMRRDIAKLLENGQEATARIRVEHIIREENMMAAQEIVELFCELIAVRHPIIETQRECPLDLKEAISIICFAAPRCSDLPELQQVQMLFADKYGREFVAAASELMPDCGVNRQIIELLSIRAPSVEAKLKLLKEIAEEHEVDWDPAASETEFLKPHEDLLNGPTTPLPKEQQEDPVSSEHTVEQHEEVDSDEGFDSLDLPEVPKVSIRATSDIPFAPGPSNPHDLSINNELNNSESSKNIEDEVNNHKPFQFVPFVASPPPFPFPLEQSDPPFSLASKNSDPTPSITHDPTRSNAPTKTHSDIDLQDVLAAAQAAAESADRAAQAARAAASLAQVRIAGLLTKKSERRTSGSSEEIAGMPTFDQQNSFGYTNPFSKVEDASPNAKDYEHQPQRSVSMEDDPYFSYPNLFNRQDSGLLPTAHSSDEHSRSGKDF